MFTAARDPGIRFLLGYLLAIGTPVLAIALRDHGWGYPQILLVCSTISLFARGHTFKSLVRANFMLIVSTFFREVSSTGSDDIPRDGPCVLVCAPHSNQFLDPLVVQHQLPIDFYSRGRRVGFLAAAKSMRRKFVGACIRMLDGVPVERPQDLAKPGDGTVSMEGGTAAESDSSVREILKITGTGTRFTEQCPGGASFSFAVKLSIDGVSKTLSSPIVKVVSDTELLLRKPLLVAASMLPLKELKYKLTPRVDQSTIFKYCHEELLSDNCIGIFPEGGSHDRTELLPIKAGVAIMALGAMAKRPDLKVHVVPVGLCYFEGHRFRSKVYVDFGVPLLPDAELVRKYKAAEPQRGAGTVVVDGPPATSVTLTGHGTEFATVLSAGDLLVIDMHSDCWLDEMEDDGQLQVEVATVISDTQITITQPTGRLMAGSKLVQARTSPTFSGRGGAPYHYIRQKGKMERREACNTLLETITQALEAVTLTAPDIDSMRAMTTARTLFKPSKDKLSSSEECKLTRMFLHAYRAAQSDPAMKREMADLLQHVDEYQSKCDELGIKVHLVPRKASDDRARILLLLVRRLLLVVLFGSVMVPGVLAMPAFYGARFIASRKAKAALAASSVKVKGRDVMATYKVMSWMFFGPMTLLFYSLLVGHYYSRDAGFLTGLVLLPLGQAAMFASDNFKVHYRSCKPLFFGLWGKKNDLLVQLVARRKEVKEEVRALIMKVDSAFNISVSGNINLHDATRLRLGLPQHKMD